MVYYISNKNSLQYYIYINLFVSCIQFIIVFRRGNDMDIDFVKIGKRIKEARKRKGYTQEALANAANLSLPHIGHIETGKTKLSLSALVTIANVLDTTPDNLLYDNVQLSVDLYDKEFKDLTSNCSPHEKQLLLEMVKQLISTMHSKSV